MHYKVLESSAFKARSLFGVVCAAFLCALLLACDTAVYHPDEIRAQKKFQSIVAGITEEELKKQLGQPLGHIAFDQTRGIYQYFTSIRQSTAVEFRTLSSINNSHPSELRLLPTGKHANKILVFVDGTVHGYFYFGQNGRLEDKAVVVS
ncbi:MAG: hypothetical protein KF814_07035 [Nitrospiraceae bacterium]|nr:hypothetical protein [Nitrospiraceae bacterium]